MSRPATDCPTRGQAAHHRSPDAAGRSGDPGGASLEKSINGRFHGPFVPPDVQPRDADYRWTGHFSRAPPRDPWLELDVADALRAGLAAAVTQRRDYNQRDESTRESANEVDGGVRGVVGVVARVSVPTVTLGIPWPFLDECGRMTRAPSATRDSLASLRNSVITISRFLSSTLATSRIHPCDFGLEDPRGVARSRPGSIGGSAPRWIEGM